MQFSIVINRPIDRVFHLISDLSNYSKWLPPSHVFSEVTQISNEPIKIGTTYIDQGSSIVMQGNIVEFNPPFHITFCQENKSKLLMFNAGMDIKIQYSLETAKNGTQVTRDFTLHVLGILNLIQPVLVNTIRKENERILQVMKNHLEAQL